MATKVEGMKKLAVVGCVLLGACQSSGAAGVSVDDAAMAFPGSTARRVTFPAQGAGQPGYSILMPADLTLQPVEPYPNPTLLFKGDGILFRFALGWNGLPGCPRTEPSCEKREIIAGREARYVSVDVSMPNAIYNRRYFYLFTSSEGGVTFIDMFCAQAACPRAEDVVRSIKFTS